MNKQRKDLSIAYFIVALAVIFVAQYLLVAGPVETIGYSQFKSLLRNGQITDVVVREKTNSGAIRAAALKEVYSADKVRDLGESAKEPLPFVVVRVDDPRLTADLEQMGIPFKGEAASDWLPAILSWVAPIVIFFLLMNEDRQMHGFGLLTPRRQRFAFPGIMKTSTIHFQICKISPP